jgi:hypothetical protein
MLMMATMEIITLATHMIEIKLYIQFLVATISTKKLKPRLMMTPYIAEVTNAFSLIMNYHASEA